MFLWTFRDRSAVTKKKKGFHLRYTCQCRCSDSAEQVPPGQSNYLFKASHWPWYRIHFILLLAYLPHNPKFLISADWEQSVHLQFAFLPTYPYRSSAGRVIPVKSAFPVGPCAALQCALTLDLLMFSVCCFHNLLQSLGTDLSSECCLGTFLVYLNWFQGCGGGGG